jgi:hypothetical protein
MKNQLVVFLSIICEWRNIFSQSRVFFRVESLALALLLAKSKKTVSKLIETQGLAQVDWSANYRIFNRSPWSPNDLFIPIIRRALPFVNETVVTLAYDDTLIKKTGKKIYNVGRHLDPLSPAFLTNLAWGFKCAQASIILPMYNRGPIPPRAIPVLFNRLPYFKKPGRRASFEEQNTYKNHRKTNNISTSFVQNLYQVRRGLDAIGEKKRLLVVADGSYCNRTCLTADIENVSVLARIRKNAKLSYAAKDSSRRFYSLETITPDQIRANEAPYQRKNIFYGGAFREVRFKEVKDVYWRGSTKRLPLRLIVIAPTPYKLTKSGSTHYRQPSFFVTRDMNLDVELLLQKCFDRWQIEVNFQEEKGLMGLGNQQQWTKDSIDKVLSFVVASYSALLLSSLELYGDDPNSKDLPALSKWNKRHVKRITCRRMIANISTNIEKDDKFNSKFFGIIQQASKKIA